MNEYGFNDIPFNDDDGDKMTNKADSTQPIATPRTLLEKADTLCQRMEADQRSPQGAVREIIFAIRDTLRDNAALTQHVADLKAEVARLREALEHYADESNWGDGYVHLGDWMDGYQPEAHGYEIAREALQAISRIKEGRDEQARKT